MPTPEYYRYSPGVIAPSQGYKLYSDVSTPFIFGFFSTLLMLVTSFQARVGQKSQQTNNSKRRDHMATTHLPQSADYSL
uniref:Uncharacterized protein n=1 Tax=Steinernema glaseri TaxID=37863 RepID=A0A1I8AJ29_9BILA